MTCITKCHHLALLLCVWQEADRREQEEHERHLRLVQRVVAEELQDAASVASQSDSDVSETDAETEVVYEITVVTSTERGAGTDANVWVEIEGDSGSTGEVLLHSAGIKVCAQSLSCARPSHAHALSCAQSL